MPRHRDVTPALLCLNETLFTLTMLYYGPGIVLPARCSEHAAIPGACDGERDAWRLDVEN